MSPTRYFRQKPRATGAEVVVYVRANCHLCDEAITQVKAAIGEHFRVVDIDLDEVSEQLRATYTHTVPVVQVDGKTVAELFVSQARLRRAVQAKRGWLRNRKFTRGKNLPH